MTTLQPASTFLSAPRERPSYAQCAGGRSARSGPSHVNGAACNPRVPIAVLTIFRIYYNWFEARPYVGGWSGTTDIEDLDAGTTIPHTPGPHTPGPDIVAPTKSGVHVAAPDCGARPRCAWELERTPRQEQHTQSYVPQDGMRQVGSFPPSASPLP